MLDGIVLQIVLCYVIKTNTTVFNSVLLKETVLGGGGVKCDGLLHSYG